MIMMFRRDDVRAKTTAFALGQSKVCRKKKPTTKVSNLRRRLDLISLTCAMAGLSTHDSLFQTDSFRVEAPAEAEPGATARVRKGTTEGSKNAEGQDFKYPERGGLFSPLLLINNAKDRLHWWPLTRLPVIGGL